MGFIRENLLKIVIFIIVLVVLILVFTIFFGKNIAKKATTYNDMEGLLVNATKKYANDNVNKIPTKEEESNKVTLDTLENFGYIKELKALEDANVKCTGYTQMFYKNKNVVYVPYLKCGKYYETKSIADYILDKETIVSSGDGLYKKGNTYVFRGEEPNNYLGIGNRLYRIIDINENGEVRLISENKFDISFVWDDRYNPEKDENSGFNTYSKSRLKEYFDYMIAYNDTDEKSEYNYFSAQEMDKMIAHNVCTGKRSILDDRIDASVDCAEEEPNQYLSLIRISDYAQASIDQNCKTIYDKSCVNYNYLAHLGNNTFRTMNSVSDNSYQVYYINYGVADVTRASNSFNANLVIYIDKLSLYASGLGTYDEPYVIR